MAHIPDPRRFERRIKKEAKKDYKKLHDLEKKAHAITRNELDGWIKNGTEIYSRLKEMAEKLRG